MQATVTARVDPHTAPATWGRAALTCRVALVMCWVVMLVVAMLFGARPSTWNTLVRAVQDGQVTQVRVSDERPVTKGQTTVDLSWRSGPWRRTTTVVETTGSETTWSNGVSAVVPFTVADRLRTIGAVVEMSPAQYAGKGVLGWRLPAWATWLLLVVCAATLAALLCLPEPWRATRWSWFWLMLVGQPVGVIAYLLLAGPFPYIRAPRSGPRLTGGRALVLALGINLAVLLTSAYAAISL